MALFCKPTHTSLPEKRRPARTESMPPYLNNSPRNVNTSLLSSHLGCPNQDHPTPKMQRSSHASCKESHLTTSSDTKRESIPILSSWYTYPWSFVPSRCHRIAIRMNGEKKRSITRIPFIPNSSEFVNEFAGPWMVIPDESLLRHESKTFSYPRSPFFPFSVLLFTAVSPWGIAPFLV